MGLFAIYCWTEEEFGSLGQSPIPNHYYAGQTGQDPAEGVVDYAADVEDGIGLAMATTGAQKEDNRGPRGQTTKKDINLNNC